MLSFVLLHLEPLFRYDSREWSGESTELAEGHVPGCFDGKWNLGERRRNGLSLADPC
ncbi:BQ5605_C027g10431 [Microbotryum silenes-dioicae]|uniref:BQ5605_C027g10431 protein n=1 Tax=Microbotryum silenes-dioicae TaxID=796604 RepID=A0A2X0MNG9_9BASI|nr:BQ5605_C027g10431 [Microbotryum silenes-dioicae]